MNAAHWSGLALTALLAIVLVAALRRSPAPAMQRFVAKRGAALSLAWLAFVALAAIAAPWLAPYRPAQQLDIIALTNQPPSWVHPLGTDFYSRDLLSRILFGARVSL